MFDVWQNVLTEIEQNAKISHDAFVTFLDGTNLISTDDGNIIIGVPNVFKVNMIEKKYSGIIREALIHNNIEVNTLKCQAMSDSKVKKKPREITTAHIDKPTIQKQIRPIKKNTLSTGLNPNYTMDNFVIGTNNDTAVAFAKGVIDNPGVKCNPFFLYGGPGLGKTHLVQAIGNALVAKDPSLKILYMPVSDFYSEFISSIQNKVGDAFSQKFKKLDVLIIDDFQMIIGKDASQEEFFNIFNTLHQANKQIIVTCDRLPDQIKSVDTRLASRLAWGGPIDLQMPKFEDKCAILKSKAEFLGIDIEDEAIEYLAQNVKTNIRELEGAFNKLTTLAEIRNISPLEIINSGYMSGDSGSRRNITSARKIVEKVAKFYNLSVDEMCGKSRVSHIKTARQIAMYLLQEELSLSFNKIAAEVGVKDHTTVMHGTKKIRGDLNTNFSLREDIASIRENIYE